MDNLKLWNSWGNTPAEIIKTDADGLKQVAPIHKFKKATENLGIYGKDWGLKKIEIKTNVITQSIVFAEIKAVFYAKKIEIETEANASKQIVGVRDDVFYVDGSYAQSLETYLIGKTLSKLGMYADTYTSEVETIEQIDTLEDADLDELKEAVKKIGGEKKDEA